MGAASRERINDETVQKSVNALLKWRKKFLSQQSDHAITHEEEDEEEDEQQVEEESDDFMYLSVTLKKVPQRDLTLAPHKIPLRHSLLAEDYSNLNFCLIVDGKRITSESANKILKALGFPFIKQVLKLSKLKSDYKSFESKKKLYDSFDVFFAAKNVAPLLPKVLGKVFYKKKRKVPAPLDLKADGSNWKEEIETACNSSLWCLSGGTCSAVRVGKWGITESKEIVENVYEAIDGVLKIVPKKWSGIRCFHLKFSNSVALPIYEYQNDENKTGITGNGNSGFAETKKRRRRRTD